MLPMQVFPDHPSTDLPLSRRKKSFQGIGTGGLRRVEMGQPAGDVPYGLSKNVPTARTRGLTTLLPHTTLPALAEPSALPPPCPARTPLRLCSINGRFARQCDDR